MADKNLKLSNLEKYKELADQKYAAEFVAKADIQAVTEEEVRACFPEADAPYDPPYDPGDGGGTPEPAGTIDATDDDIRDLFG